MKNTARSILLVDDYAPWRTFVAKALKKKPELTLAGVADDGAEAVCQAKKLKPDLVIIDTGLPTMNGIEAAKRIRKASPESKILLVSEVRYPEVVEKP